MNQTQRLEIEAFLSELATEREPVLYVPNSGNAGDSLIGHATFQLFDRLGLQYECLADPRGVDPSGRIVICAGGGNLVPLYHGSERVLRWASGRARRIIVLPHTIRGHDELLAALGPEVDLICREEVSHRHVRAAVRSAHCHLADDLAFSLDVRRTLASPPPRPPQWSLSMRKLGYRLMRSARAKTLPSPWKIRRGDRLMASRRAESGAHDGATGTLHAYRTDVEKTAAPVPEDNLDPAQEFSHGTRSPWVCHSGSYYLLGFLDTYEEIVTNRLHVGIGAALLGKRVRLGPNSYCKNRAVFEFSLRDRFPKVEWQEGEGTVLSDAPSHRG